MFQTRLMIWLLARTLTQALSRLQTRRTGATSNAGSRKFAAQVENCDRGDARCGRDSGGRSVLAAGGLSRLTEAADQRTPGGTDEEDPRCGTAARHAQEDRIGERSNRRLLQ